MSETKKTETKAYEFPAQWFKVTELEQDFGKAFVAMRDEYIAYGRKQLEAKAKLEAMFKAKLEKDLGGELPEDKEAVMLRGYPGSIGFSIRTKATKVAKTKEPEKSVTERLAAFGSVLVKKDQSMKDAGMASVPLPAELDRRGKRK